MLPSRQGGFQNRDKIYMYKEETHVYRDRVIPVLAPLRDRGRGVQDWTMTELAMRNVAKNAKKIACSIFSS